MFERSFFWTMKHGARVLFAVALLYLVLGIVQAVLSVVALGRGPSGVIEKSTLFLAISSLLGPFSTSGLLLFGALVVDRLDKWLSSKETS